MATIKLVKPEKAMQIEMQLLSMAQSGRLKSQVQESQLISMMEGMAAQAAKANKITFARRRNNGWSDEEDDDDSDLL